MLIRHGADVTAIDLGGGTAQESACKMGKTALAAAGVFHVPQGLNKTALAAAGLRPLALVAV
jgi:hypothetical protein